MADWTVYLLLLAAGGVAGVINVIAGGGSFLTLPLLIVLGLPATIANGTNRVAILFQNLGAVWGFHRYGVVDWRAILWAAVPATIGSIFGALAALAVTDDAFKKILAVLMVGVTLLMLWNPFDHTKHAPSLHPSRLAHTTSGLLLTGFGFFGAGLYGGFVQAGVGFFILAMTTLAGLDLVRGNAVKVLTVLALTTVSLGLFIWNGKVHWPMGLTLAAGNLIGALLGVRLTVLKGHAWVKGVVTITVLLFAVKLWLL